MPTEIKGALELRVALRKFAPDLSKETQKEMAAALRTVTSKARGFVPSDSQVLSNWAKPIASEKINYRPFPRYSSFDAKRGITYKTTPSRPNRSGFVALARILNTSAAGAIYETSGRKNAAGRIQADTREVVIPTWRRDTGVGEHRYTTTTGKNYGHSLNPNAGKQFIDNLNETGQLVNARPVGLKGRPSRKQTGRLIFRAWAEDNGRANTAVIKAIENSALKFDQATRKAS
jgi:hypothetical protein